MQTFQASLAVVGTGDAGLRATIAATQANPNAKVTLISEVYPMRDRVVAAEEGSAAITQDHDSFEYHFHNTVTGGDWLYEQDVVDYFVRHCLAGMTQPELWRCPWSRCSDDSVNVRRFGGMKIEHTWLAVDKTGFRMLYTLFRTSLQFPQVQRFDEHFVLSILVDDNHVRGLVAMNMMEGTLVQIYANAVIMVAGGTGRVYRYNTNGDIVTDDGMDMALSHGVPLCDMEFVQYHPTGLPGSGTLMTEGCRGEGGILVNKNGYRYLQDYGMDPETPLDEPKNKYMELGLRDKVSQAFWHKWREGSAISTPRGDAVYLDLYHLGGKELHERLPFIYELTKVYVGVDPVREPIPVRPTAHYTVDGIETDQSCETRIKGPFAVDECSPVDLHGANRLSSNSLTELMIFGRLAGEQATERTVTADNDNEMAVEAQAVGVEQRLKDLVDQDDGENWAKIRDEMGMAMEEDCDIYHTPELIQKTTDKLVELRERFRHVRITDTSNVSNTDLFYTIELDHSLDVIGCMTHSAMARKESHGAHQRLNGGCTECDDVNFLKHTLTFRDTDGTTRLEYSDVKITTLPPAKHVYGGEADTADKTGAVNKKEKADGRDEKPEN